MKICFVLPRYYNNPLGGYKIVYEYANRLSCIGDEVSILYLNDELPQRKHVPIRLMKAYVGIVSRKSPVWYKLNKSVKLISATARTWERDLGTQDIYITTAAETAEPVANLFPNSKKAYFIQDYETFSVDEAELRRTYSMDYQNIVVSRWLKELVDKYSLLPSKLISNPLDLSIYTVISNPSSRNKHTLGLLYHNSERKGLEYSFKAIDKLKRIYPDLKVYMFGTQKLDFLPDYFIYTRSASQRETVDIYNSIQVFMCSTISEGFGLTGMEAMACGAALASTDYLGVREYAKNGINALLSPVRDVDTMVANVCKLFEDDSLRQNIVSNGVQSLKSRDWSKAVNGMHSILEEYVDKK